MSKPPPPNGQIAPGDFIAQRTARDNTPTLHDEQTTAQLRAARIATERSRHDARVAANIAAALAQAWQRDQARAAPPPRRPGEGEVPAERFGPADRRVGSERR